jgi:hypothetical protein
MTRRLFGTPDRPTRLARVVVPVVATLVIVACGVQWDVLLWGPLP